jgi:hypothetical protein
VALRFTRFGALCGALAMVCLLTVASAQATHPRPKSASPIHMSLVPAYAPCAAPNRTHGPPLAFASCSPPAETSSQATVGTPDAFGGAANSASHLRLKEVPSIPPDPDSSDMLIDIALNDVRCVPTGARCGTANASGPADYSGEMRFSFTFRLTDHWNAADPDDRTAATVQDFTIEYDRPEYPWPCVQSTSTSTGSTCALLTTLNSFIPGEPVREARRMVWALDAVRIFDGGADGDGDTTGDNTIFARPGVFIP